MSRSFHRLFAAALLPAAFGLAACGDDDTPGPSHRTSAAPTAPVMEMAHSASATGFAVQVLSRSNFPDNIDATFRVKLSTATNVVHVDDPSDVVVAIVTIQPGGSLGWHTHHGPAIASVAAGELSIKNASDCVTRRYAATDAFVDPGQGNVHIGFNEGTTDAVVYVTFLDVPPGQSPTIVAADPGC